MYVPSLPATNIVHGLPLIRTKCLSSLSSLLTLRSVDSSIPSFIHSAIRSFTQSFIHSFNINQAKSYVHGTVARPRPATTSEARSFLALRSHTCACCQASARLQSSSCQTASRQPPYIHSELSDSHPTAVTHVVGSRGIVASTMLEQKKDLVIRAAL
jgi:hypothetical protein